MIPKNAFMDAKCVCGSEKKVDSNGLDKILEKHGKDPSALLTILGEIQSTYRYLPANALRIVAEETGCSLVDVYGAATFYRSFSLEPKGQHLISVCMGTACHVRGAPKIVEEFEKQLGIGPGETTSDCEFSLETPNCLGACALGPIVVADGKYFSNVTTARVSEIITRVRSGLTDDDSSDIRFFQVDVSCPACNRSLMDDQNTPFFAVTAACNGSKFPVRLSSIYGRNTAHAEQEIPLDSIVEILCPHCQTSMNGPSVCVECEAPMARFAVRGGGMLYLCSRWGCDGHLLDMESHDKSTKHGCK